MNAAAALGERGRGRTAPNPSVGCLIVADGRMIGRGWTQDGGRPHAEAMALAEAGDAALGATAYVTLEPCAEPGRGPACCDALIAAGVAKVVAAIGDPDPRVDGKGFEKLQAAGIHVETGVGAERATRAMAGFLTRQRLGRPFVTLKLAMSLDGKIAPASGESRWITGAEARAHAHLERARSEMILVGRVTLETDAPALDVRLEGLEQHSPRRAVLTTGDAPDGWEKVASPSDIAALDRVDHLLVEGGAGAASAFLAADLVDRLLVYRAPILIGEGKPALGDIGLRGLADAHRRWHLHDSRMLGIDRLDVYERVRQDVPGSS